MSSQPAMVPITVARPSAGDEMARNAIVTLLPSTPIQVLGAWPEADTVSVTAFVSSLQPAPPEAPPSAVACAALASNRASPVRIGQRHTRRQLAGGAHAHRRARQHVTRILVDDVDVQLAADRAIADAAARDQAWLAGVGSGEFRAARAATSANHAVNVKAMRFACMVVSG